MIIIAHSNAVGVSLLKNASFVMGDSVINVVNATSVSASSEDSAEYSILVRVHCVLMVAGLSIFGPIGIFFSAWLKPVLSKKAVWFQVGGVNSIATCII